MPQHSHNTVPFQHKKFKIVVVCDHLQSPANIGAIFRLCDAFGVSELLFTNKPDLTSSRLKRTARTTEQHVEFKVTDDIIASIKGFHDKGYVSVALEITESSIPLTKLATLIQDRSVLIIGNEKHGVSDEVLALAQYACHIDMFGKNSSMNVAQATAIALYELTKH